MRGARSLRENLHHGIAIVAETRFGLKVLGFVALVVVFVAWVSS